MTVHVYGKPGCMQCEYTSKLLGKDGHDVHYHDILADPQARKAVEESGKMQLPLVVAGNQSWNGFSPDRIKSLAA